MALSVEVLQEIQYELIWRAITLETEAENLREDLNEDYLTEECKAMSRKAAAECDAEAARVRGLIACIEEELGREKADT